MLNRIHMFSALISIPDGLLGVWAFRLHQHRVIIQSCVSTVKFLIMWFVLLPLALVVKYLSNQSVRKVKYIYKGLKLLSQVEPCTLCRILARGRAFALLLPTCCNICEAVSGYKRGFCVSPGGCGGNKLLLIVVSSYIMNNKELFLRLAPASSHPAAHLPPSPAG